MKALLTLLNISLAGLALWLGTGLLEKKQAAPEAAPVQAEPGMGDAAMKNRPDSRPSGAAKDYGEISHRNLFGVQVTQSALGSPVPKPMVRPVSTKKTPEVPVPYTLSGTVTGGTDLYAVIRDKKGGKQLLVKQGETIGRFRVKQVERKQVVLSEDGRERILEMAETPEPATKGKSRPETLPSKGKPAEPDSPLEPALPTHIILDREEVAAALAEIDAVKNKISTRPHLTRGARDGVVIYRLRPDSIFQMAGLQNGDILMSMNGAPLADTHDVMQLPVLLETGEPVTLELGRQDKMMEFNYTLAD